MGVIVLITKVRGSAKLAAPSRAAAVVGRCPAG
jgi:hypothetical protein